MTHNIEPELLGPLPRATRRRYGLVLQLFIAIFIFPHTLAGLALAANVLDDIARKLFPSMNTVPSSVVFYGSYVGSILLPTLFWNTAVFYVIWHFFIAPWRQQRLVRCGTPVVGRITGRHTSGMGRRATYLIEYEYPDDSGTVLTGEMNLRAEDWEQAYMFVPVTVLYDPKRPRRSIVYQFSRYAAC